MPRIKLTAEEKEKRKLARRAARKAERKMKKEAAVIEESTKTKKDSGSVSGFKLIEIAVNDREARKKISELKETGVPVRWRAYATDYFIYQVPSNLKGFTEHGSSVAIKDEDDITVENPLKSIDDLIAKIETDRKTGIKLNKRYIKLLVRNSELKRNEKRQTIETLIKKFEIK